MNGASLLSFLAMGGYATYVWPAYGMFFIVLLIDWLAPQFRRRQLLRGLRARIARQSTRKDPMGASFSLGEDLVSSASSPRRERGKESSLP